MFKILKLLKVMKILKMLKMLKMIKILNATGLSNFCLKIFMNKGSFYLFFCCAE